MGHLRNQEKTKPQNVSAAAWATAMHGGLAPLALAPVLALLLPMQVHAGVATPSVDISVSNFGVTPFEIHIEYSEAVTGLTQSDFYVTNASITSFTGSGTSYTMTLQPALTGAIDVYLGPYASQSVSTGDNSRGFQRLITQDMTRPTAQFWALPLTGCTIPHTVFFNDQSLDTGVPTLDGPNVWNYDFGDGNISTLQNPVHNYVAYGSYTIELTVTHAFSGFQDSATQTILVDDTFATTLGVAVEDSLIGPNGSTATFRFSEPIEDLTASQLTFSGVTIDRIYTVGDASTWAVDFSPTAGSPQASIALRGHVIRDRDSGCPSDTTDTSFVRNVDLDPPTIEIAAASGSLNSGQSTTVTFTLSEASTDFDASDIIAMGGSVSAFSGSGTSYQATFTPDPDSIAGGSVSVASGTFSDPVGNFNVDGADTNNQVTFAIDTQTPTIGITAARSSIAAGQTVEIQFQLSEPAADFDQSDIVVSGGSLSAFNGIGSNYTATFTPTPDSTQPAVISVASGRFSDAAGNLNADGDDSNNRLTLTVDTLLPTVSLTSTATTFSDSAEIQVIATFSETVTEFTASDVQVTNGRVTRLSGAGANYSLTLVASGAGDLSVAVPANAARDDSGNGNTASNVLAISNQTVAATQTAIAKLVTSRATQLLSHQPDLRCHLDGGCGSGRFAADVTRDAISFNAQSRPDQPVWMRLTGSRTLEADRDSDYVFAAFGTHTAVSANTLFGLMLQLDHIRQRDGSSTAQGQGWLAGPHVVSRLPDQPLVFEGQVLVGQAHNSISPFGTYKDHFDSRRVLAKLALSGQFTQGKTTLSPKVAASYVSERQDSYIDSLSNLIPGQKLESRQIELGLDVSRPFEGAKNTWILGAGMSALASRTTGTGAIGDLVHRQDGPRGRIDLSASTQVASGALLDFSLFYDGLGQADFESYGASLDYSLQF